MGEEFLSLQDPEDVRNIIASLNLKKRIEKVNLSDSLGRLLAEDVYATIDLPPFDRAAMDGYAVMAHDTFKASEDNHVILNLIERIKAGDVPAKKVEPGTCSEIGTGAPIPPGADAVVMVEFTDSEGELNDSGGEIVKILEAVAPGTNIALRGSDMGKGKLLISKGTLISPEKIGVLSAIGMSEVPVFRKPRVAVISTGNELIKPTEELEYGKLYDINSESISAALKSCGCIPLPSTIAKDDYNSIKDKINEFKHADVIITSGGTSAGAGDVLRQVVEDMGQVLVHGISIKPGKPTLIGKLPDDKGTIILFGLPGYPVSALTIFQVFFAPFLRTMAGFEGSDNDKKALKLKISGRYHSARGRSHIALVKIDEGFATPILKDSGAITAMAEADGFFVVPKNVEIIDEGEEIKVMPLSGLHLFS